MYLYMTTLTNPVGILFGTITRETHWWRPKVKSHGIQEWYNGYFPVDLHQSGMAILCGWFGWKISATIHHDETTIYVTKITTNAK